MRIVFYVHHVGYCRESILKYNKGFCVTFVTHMNISWHIIS